MATTNASLIESAAALVPTLRKTAPAAEKARRVPAESYDALSQAGIFKMTAPKAWRSRGRLPNTVRRAGRDRTRLSIDVLGSHDLQRHVLAGRAFPDETQEEIATRDPRIAGVFSPTGTAVAKDGFVVNGRWPFNTGCHGATWTVLNVLVGGILTCMIANYVDLKILDDWYAAGMSATGSNTVVAENVFVPARRAMPLPDMLEARYPARHNANNPYFKPRSRQCSP